MQSPTGGVSVPGVELGELLGKGSYGRVFLGSWHGEEVAIKVSIWNSMCWLLSI